MMDLVELMERRDLMLAIGMKMKFGDDYEPERDLQEVHSPIGISQYSRIISSTEGSRKYFGTNKNNEAKGNGNKKS